MRISCMQSIFEEELLMAHHTICLRERGRQIRPLTDEKLFHPQININGLNKSIEIVSLSVGSHVSFNYIK